MCSPNPSLTLFSLPAEIRLKIYEYVLTAPHTDYGQFISWIDPRLFRSDESNRSLLQTCQAINSEASPVFYRVNRFFGMDPNIFRSWLKVIGPVNTTYLRNLSIEAQAWTDHKLWYELFCTLARGAMGLHHIFIKWNHDVQPDGFYFWCSLSKTGFSERMDSAGYSYPQWSKIMLEMETQVPVSLDARTIRIMGFFQPWYPQLFRRIVSQR